MIKKITGLVLCLALMSGIYICCIEGGSGALDGQISRDAQAQSDTKNTSAQNAGSQNGSSENYILAFVPKSGENKFNEKEAEGFKSACKRLGATAVVSYPKEPTADAQIEVIMDLIEQKVDGISVAANDANALSDVLTQAANAGIKINTVDSDTAMNLRSVYCNPADADEVAAALIETVYEICGGEGQFAILSTTPGAANQMAWIDSIKAYMENDSKYSYLDLVEVAYGKDDADLSAQKAGELLSDYPDLKCICAPTTVGMLAAAKTITQTTTSVKLTGLGLPSEMEPYIGTEGLGICPRMYLWNPRNLGALSAYTLFELCNGEITGAQGDSFSCPLGRFNVTLDGDGVNEIVLGEPFGFDRSNVSEWVKVY